MTTPASSVGDRIRQVRLTHGLTQKAFADSLGIVQGFLSSVERGRKLPSDTLIIALAHRYGLNEAWLLAGEGEMRQEPGPAVAASPAPAEGRASLLKRIPPNFPDLLNPDDVIGELFFPGIDAGCFAITAFGDYMAPTIQDGDIVVFRIDDQLKNRDIVLINNKWGEIIMRRYRVSDGQEWFSPDNSVYTPFQRDSANRVVGIVTAVWRSVKF